MLAFLGFNDPVRALAFLLGFAVIGVVAVAGQVVMPGLAAPIAFALLAAWFLETRPWVPSGYSALVGLGTLGLWLLEQSTEKVAPVVVRFVPMLWAITFGFALIALVRLVASIGRAEAAKKRALPALSLLLVLTLLVALFSGNAGGAGFMKRLYLTVLHLSPAQADVAVLATRKAIHFLFYTLVGFAAAAAGRSGGEPPAVARVTGLGYGLLLAAFDEVRQTSASNRTGSPWDVLLDLTGVLTGVTLALRASRGRARS